MLYKCDHCNYTTSRKCDLHRHINRKNPCNKNLKVVVDNVEETRNPQNINATNTQSMNANTPSMNANHNSKIFTCSKCQKQFNRKDKFKLHIAKCDGLDSKQCKICFKMFTTAQGKYQHNKYVKCSPPLSQQQPHTVHNITNNIDNSVDNSTNNTNNTQNINIQLTLNFGNEDLSGLISDPNYMNNVEDQIQSFISQLPYLNEDAGKIIISEIMKKIYFNKEYPQNQTIKKTCKKDKMVKIFEHDQWKNRVINDVFKRMSGKMQEYFCPYFESLSEKYEGKSKEELSLEDKCIITNSRGFGNRMAWFDWDEIIDPIVEINNVIEKQLQLPESDEDEIKQEKIIKNTINFLSHELYDNTKQIV